MNSRLQNAFLGSLVADAVAMPVHYYYVEEYHRAFFDNRARGKPLDRCGTDDVHIGGLAAVPALVAALDALDDMSVEADCRVVATHVNLTHRNSEVRKSAGALVQMLRSVADGATVREAIARHGTDWAREPTLEEWASRDDREVVHGTLSPACYLPESFTASLFLAWKYADDFSAGVVANARCGGDNCHRGAVVGSLLGAAHEIGAEWLETLPSMDRLRCDTLEATF